MAGLKDKKKQKKCQAYRAAGTREKNRERRLAKAAKREEHRAKPLPCGHGSRHRHPDGECRRCFVGHGRKAKAAA